MRSALILERMSRLPATKNASYVEAPADVEMLARGKRGAERGSTPAGRKFTRKLGTGGKGGDKGGKFVDLMGMKGIDPSLQQLLEMMCKQICMNAQSVRELRGVLCHTIILPSDLCTVTAVREEMARYLELAAANPKGHGMGPPAPYLASVAFSSLSDLDVGQKNRQGVSDALETMKGMSNDDLLSTFPIFKIAKTFKQ